MLPPKAHRNTDSCSDLLKREWIQEEGEATEKRYFPLLPQRGQRMWKGCALVQFVKKEEESEEKEDEGDACNANMHFFMFQPFTVIKTKFKTSICFRF